MTTNACDPAVLVAAVRADLGMSQAAVGVITGRSAESIRRYERGDHRPPAIFFHDLLEAAPECGLRFNDIATVLGYRLIASVDPARYASIHDYFLGVRILSGGPGPASRRSSASHRSTSPRSNTGSSRIRTWCGVSHRFIRPEYGYVDVVQRFRTLRPDEVNLSLRRRFRQLWRQHDRHPSAVDRITAELDRRDRQRAVLLDEPEPTTGPDLDPEAAAVLAELDADLAQAAAQADAEAAERARQAAVEARIDALVARGWDYAEAYAEVHNLDPNELRRQELAAALDVHRAAGETREQATRRLYHEWVHLQWIAAEKQARGFLLSRDGVKAGVDPRELWGGTAARVRRYASEELKRWWTEHTRKTYTQFRAELLGRAIDRQAAARSAGQGNDRDSGL